MPVYPLHRPEIQASWYGCTDKVLQYAFVCILCFHFKMHHFCYCIFSVSSILASLKQKHLETPLTLFRFENGLHFSLQKKTETFGNNDADIHLFPNWVLSVATCPSLFVVSGLLACLEIRSEMVPKCLPAQRSVLKWKGISVDAAYKTGMAA